jgi:hypothetical protein
MKRTSRSRSVWAAGLGAIIVALLALAACGGSGGPTATRPSTLPPRSTPVPAYSFDPGPGTTAGLKKSTDGLEFVPWVDIEVSALGFCDAGGDGLLNSHTVGIFDTDTKELVTPTVVVDSESSLDGSYRYESITPVVLKEGRSYMVVGDNQPPFDPVAFDTVAGGGSHIWEPELRFIGHSESYGDFEFPGWRNRYLWMTPNFKFMPVADSSPTP